MAGKDFRDERGHINWKIGPSREGVLITRRHGAFYVRRDGELGLLLRLSLAVAALLLLAAGTGLLVPSIYRDAPLWAAQARGVNLVDLVVAVPALVVSTMLSASGSFRARIVWLGVLGYVLYDEVIFAFDIAFNPLFLVYVALLSLSTFSLIVALTHLDVARFRPRFPSRAPTRGIATYFVIIAALFFLAWMKDIIPATLGNTTPASILQAKIPSNPVYVLDLGFLIPLYIVTAIWLLRRRGWGYVLAGLLLVLNSLLSLSIVLSTVFQYAVDHTVSLAVVPMFGAIAVVSLSLTVRYLRGLRRDS